MGEVFRKPEPLAFDSRIGKCWRLFVAASYYDKPAKARDNLLLSLAGDKAYERAEQFAYAGEVTHPPVDGEALVVIPAETAVDPECLKRKFRQLCNPQANPPIEWVKFFSRNQNEGETIELFVCAIKKAARSCRFVELQDEFIRDRLVCGLVNDKLRY